MSAIFNALLLRSLLERDFELIGLHYEQRNFESLRNTSDYRPTVAIANELDKIRFYISILNFTFYVCCNINKLTDEQGRRWKFLAEGVQGRGFGGQKSPSGVQGRSPCREFGGQSPPEAEALLKNKY